MNRRRRRRGGGGGRPQSHGLAFWLSWVVALSVTYAMSSAVASEIPARAWRRKIRHQPSCRLSQQAPTGMNAWSIRWWPASQSRVGTLLWLDRLSH